MINVNEIKNKIINADCMDILKQLPDNCIDCVVSDIPYKIGTGGVGINTNTSGILKQKFTKDRLKNKWLKKHDNDISNDILISRGQFFENIPKFETWLPEIYRILKEQTHCYLMINARNLAELQTKAEKFGFKFQQICIWVKNNATPNKWYMGKTEYILMLRKGHERYINNLGQSNVFVYSNILGNKYHPNEKPIELMQDLIINSTNENDLVLDMFMGAGSTCLACKKSKRNYIGIEIEEKYYNIAKSRIESEISYRNKSNEQLKLL